MNSKMKVNNCSTKLYFLKNYYIPEIFPESFVHCLHICSLMVSFAHMQYLGKVGEKLQRALHTSFFFFSFYLTADRISNTESSASSTAARKNQCISFCFWRKSSKRPPLAIEAFSASLFMVKAWVNFHTHAIQWWIVISYLYSFLFSYCHFENSSRIWAKKVKGKVKLSTFLVFISNRIFLRESCWERN